MCENCYLYEGHNNWKVKNSESFIKKYNINLKNSNS